MVTTRMEKFDELILREVSKELATLFPNEFISVTQVHVSKDLAFAKVWISSYKEVDEIVEKCKQKSAEIRKNLARKIKARKVPSLYFVPDKTEDEAGKIEALFKKIKEDEAKDDANS